MQDEIELQDALEDLFRDAGLPYQREVTLGERMRVDFMVGSIAIEIKVAGSRNSVMRQLARYADCDAIEIVVLVTTVAQHYMPPELKGVPVHVIKLITF